MTDQAALRLDWLEKLQYYLQTLAFCLAISALQYAVQPSRPYEIPLIYSLCIGTFTWALMDFGRHLFPSSRGRGWPTGLASVLLPVSSIVAGYFIGTLSADAYFGWSSWDIHARSELPASIVITAVAGIVASYYFYSRSKSAFLELQMQQARQQAAQAQLKVLQTQLDPHLLFNTLANLRALITIDAPAALHMLDRLDAYLRATLSASRSTEHTLADEFARLEDYLEIMRVRMGERLTYQLHLPAELAGASVPTLLLQPIVENAIRHGLEPKIEGGQVQVCAWLDSTTTPPQLHLSVQDSGVGMTDNVRESLQNHGFGLAQLRERLNQRHAHHNSITVLSPAQGGTQVDIAFAFTPQAQP